MRGRSDEAGCSEFGVEQSKSLVLSSRLMLRKLLCTGLEPRVVGETAITVMSVRLPMYLSTVNYGSHVISSGQCIMSLWADMQKSILFFL